MPSRRHILLVEEHRDISVTFSAFYEGINDFALHVVPTAREAEGLTGRNDVDVAIVDLTSANEIQARLAMIRKWRRDHRALPVIATSALDYDGLSIEIFEAGADDFVRKPYLLGEFHARVLRQLSRISKVASASPRIDGVPIPEQPFVFGGAVVSPDLRIQFPSGRVLRLTPKQFGLLQEFHGHRGTLLLRDRLIHAVWGADANTNSTSVHQYVHILRKLYRAEGIDLSALIVPESKVGWRIAESVAAVPDR